MPRFKTPDYGRKLIPVDFAQQVLPGTFEFALCLLCDNDCDLTSLRARQANDTGGIPASRANVLFRLRINEMLSCSTMFL
jgi:hypothetical protein